MNRIFVKSFLIFLSILTEVEGQGDVTFWRDEITLTCPESGEWFRDGNLFLSGQREHVIKIGDKQLYYCLKTDGNKHHFFIKGRGCENCYELEMSQIAMVMVGDLILTGSVILIVYLWAQKKSRPAAPQKPSRSRGHAPMASNVDYEPLRHGDRGKNIYAAHKNETKD